jgi:hypothetical protein
MKDTQQLTEIRAGVLSCLDGLPGVVNVRSSNAGPSSPAAISAWERKHATLLPDDLKDFYLLWDGLALRWDVIAHRREIVPLGCMAINSLAQLEPVDAAVRVQLTNGRQPRASPQPTRCSPAASPLIPFCFANGRQPRASHEPQEASACAFGSNDEPYDDILAVASQLRMGDRTGSPFDVAARPKAIASEA